MDLNIVLYIIDIVQLAAWLVILIFCLFGGHKKPLLFLLLFPLIIARVFTNVLVLAIRSGFLTVSSDNSLSQIIWLSSQTIEVIEILLIFTLFRIFINGKVDVGEVAGGR